MTGGLKEKKALLNSELLRLDEAEFKELDAKYRLEFRGDFSREIACLAQSPAEEKNKPPVIARPVFKVPKRTLKKIHRKLAMVTHPDLSGDKEKFAEVQSAYESGDISDMLAIAKEVDADIKLTDKEISVLETQIAAKRAYLEKKKTSATWTWCNSDKNDLLRSSIRRAIGLQDEVWEAYLADD